MKSGHWKAHVIQEYRYRELRCSEDIRDFNPQYSIPSIYMEIKKNSGGLKNLRC